MDIGTTHNDSRARYDLVPQLKRSRHLILTFFQRCRLGSGLCASRSSDTYTNMSDDECICMDKKMRVSIEENARQHKYAQGFPHLHLWYAQRGRDIEEGSRTGVPKQTKLWWLQRWVAGSFYSLTNECKGGRGGLVRQSPPPPPPLPEEAQLGPPSGFWWIWSLSTNGSLREKSPSPSVGLLGTRPMPLLKVVLACTSAVTDHQKPSASVFVLFGGCWACSCQFSTAFDLEDRHAVAGATQAQVALLRYFCNRSTPRCGIFFLGECSDFSVPFVGMATTTASAAILFRAKGPILGKLSLLGTSWGLTASAHAIGIGSSALGPQPSPRPRLSGDRDYTKGVNGQKTKSLCT